MELCRCNTVRGHIEILGEKLEHCYLSVTNPTWIGVNSNPVFHVEGPVTNCWSHCMTPFKESYLLHDTFSIIPLIWLPSSTKANYV